MWLCTSCVSSVSFWSDDLKIRVLLFWSFLLTLELGRASKGEKEKMRLWILRSSLEAKMHLFFTDQTMREVITSKKTGVHINQFYKSNSQIIEWRDLLLNAFIGCLSSFICLSSNIFQVLGCWLPSVMAYSSIPKIFGKVLALLRSHMTLVAETYFQEKVYIYSLFSLPLN